MTFKTPKGTELPLLDLHGKDYLQVPYRIMWFREEKPMWSITTQAIEQSETHAIFKAYISDETGRCVATAHKHEDKQGFADFREKAESGAIGRALGYLGYGTQFAQELDEGTRRIADAPLEYKKPLSVKSDPPKDAPNRTPGADFVSAFYKQAEASKPQTSGSAVKTKWSEYTLKTGKTKGETIKSIGIDGAMRYREWLEEKKRTSDKPLRGDALADLNALTAFQQECADANPAKVWRGNTPPATVEYEAPTWADEEMPKFDSDSEPPF